MVVVINAIEKKLEIPIEQFSNYMEYSSETTITTDPISRVPTSVGAKIGEPSIKVGEKQKHEKDKSTANLDAVGTSESRKKSWMQHE